MIEYRPVSEAGETSSPGELRESHRSAILSAVEGLDRMLVEIEYLMSEGHTRALIREYHQTITPAQRKQVASLVTELRRRLSRVLAKYGIGIPPPRSTTGFAAETKLTMAAVFLEEIRGEKLANFGELAEERVRAWEDDSREVQELVLQLRHAVSPPG